LVLDWLSWEGTPSVTFKRPIHNGTMWARAWVNAADYFDQWWPEDFRLVQDHGTGMLIQGGRDWQDYQVKAVITPHMAASFGLAARVQGLERYYELQLNPAGKARLVKVLDGVKVLAETNLEVNYDTPYEMRLAVKGVHIDAYVNGKSVFAVDDRNRPLKDGGIALVCEEGRIGCDLVNISPIESG
jgi:hypothetical protein